MKTLKTIFWIAFFLFCMSLWFGVEINLSPFSIKLTTWKEGIFAMLFLIGTVGYLAVSRQKAELKGYAEGYSKGLTKGGEIANSLWNELIHETVKKHNETNNQN